MIYSFFEKPYSDNQKTPEKEDDFRPKRKITRSIELGAEEFCSVNRPIFT